MCLVFIPVSHESFVILREGKKGGKCFCVCLKKCFLFFACGEVFFFQSDDGPVQICSLLFLCVSMEKLFFIKSGMDVVKELNKKKASGKKKTTGGMGKGVSRRGGSHQNKKTKQKKF